MAILTTLADTNYQPLSPVQEAGNLAFLLAEFERLFGVVNPPNPGLTITPDASTGLFTAPADADLLVSYS